MPKDNLHYGNVEHRDVHNVYGELYVTITLFIIYIYTYND